MAAFSRSFSYLFRGQSLRLPSSIRVALFAVRSQPPHAYPRAYSPSQSFFRQYARPAGYPSIPRRTPSGTFSSYDPVLAAVESSRTPILLYKAPGRQLYMLGVYALAFTTFGCSLWLLKWRYELPKDLPWFVGPTYVLMAFFFIGASGYMFSAPVGRCLSLEIVPALGRAPQMRITGQLVPWVTPKWTYVTEIGAPTINEKSHQIVLELQEFERVRTQSIFDDLEGYGLTSRFWIVFARFFQQKWEVFYLRFKFTILRFGYIKLDVGGRRWKVDCQGYMLEDGKAIDRLLVVL